MALPAETDIDSDSLRRAAIDRSVRAPVLFLFTNGAFWLMASTIVGLLASVKHVFPNFLDQSWLWFLQYGRLQPAHLTALIYLRGGRNRRRWHGDARRGGGGHRLAFDGSANCCGRRRLRHRTVVLRWHVGSVPSAG